MGVKIVNREYSNQYRNEKTNWLNGNTGDWQELSIEAEFAVHLNVSNSEPILLNSNTMTLGNGKSWNEYGIDSNDTINIVKTVVDKSNNTESTSTETRNVILAYGDSIDVDGNTFNESMHPYNDASTEIKNIEIYVDKKPEGIEINYGHLQNEDADSFNLSSFIDGTKQRFSAKNTNTLNSGIMDVLGLASGMSINSVKWDFIEKVGGYTYKYKITIEYLISSFFEDLDNLESKTPPSQTFDAESLTDNFQIIGYPKYNNPNLQIKNDISQTKKLGNTGWFDENFNGLPNNFKIESVDYTNVSENVPTNGLLYSGETRIKAVISGINNITASQTKSGIGFIWTPESDSFYKNKLTPFHENLLINTLGAFSGKTPVPTASLDPTIYNGFSFDNSIRMDIKDVHMYIQSGKLVYEATFDPTAGFKNFIENKNDEDRNYAIWISVADKDLVTNFSDRVSLLLDFAKMDKYVEPAGEWNPMIIDFFEHPYGVSGYEKTTCNDFFVEDDVLAEVRFNVDINDVIPESLEFAIEMENQVTGEKYNLQSYDVDLTVFPTDSNNIPQFDYDEIRGFKYEQGNNKNFVKVKREPSNDSIQGYGYLAQFGFKMRWEDWLERSNVPNDFFDSNEEHNGFNNDWFQYMNHADWKMQFTVYTGATKEGTSLKYVNSKPFTLKDYDSNSNLHKKWNFYRESDGTLLNAGLDPITGEPLAALIENELIRVEVVWTRQNGIWTSSNESYGTICVEVDKGSGQFDFRQISSLYIPESDNPLIPLQGMNRANLTFISPKKIKVECLLESSKLINASRYKFSARLGCYEGDAFIFTQGDPVQDTNNINFITT